MSSFATETKTGERLTGRVKWFNNKAGYGFITITDGTRSGTDVFVHHTAIVVVNQQYKYLVQGEYVEFSFTSTQGGSHEYNATNVTGVKNCGLMCENNRNYSTTFLTSNHPTSRQQNSNVYDILTMPCNRATGNYIKNDGSFCGNFGRTQYNRILDEKRPPRIIIPSDDSNSPRRNDSPVSPRYKQRDVGKKSWTNKDANNNVKTPKQTNLRENI